MPDRFAPDLSLRPCAAPGAGASCLSSCPVQLSLCLAEGTDPFSNLALEEALAHAVAPGERILYLWRNERTVVIGRNQNAWKECDAEALEADGGHLARRRSGGGAVYHDAGNLNFSFIARDGCYDEAADARIVCAAVRSFGIDAHLTGRNDLTANGAKFSGSAYFHAGGAHVHHGTLMVAVNGDALARYLRPDAGKLAAKGVDSVRARVVNLAALNPDITADALGRALVRAFEQEHGGTAHLLDRARLDAQELACARERFASWEWRFGASCPFTCTFSERFVWGDAEVSLAVREGVVSEARLCSDALDAEFVEHMARALSDVRFSADELACAIEALPCQTEAQTRMAADVGALVRTQLAERAGTDEPGRTDR